MPVDLRIKEGNRLEIGAKIIILSLLCFLIYYLQSHVGKTPNLSELQMISPNSSLQIVLPNFSHLSLLSYFVGVPLISKDVWWRNRRIWFAPAFLTVLLILTQIFASSVRFPRTEYYFGLVMIIFIVVIVAFLSERIEKVRRLSQLNEELEIEREKLKDANDELESFAYSISHDLRVPLRAIDGFSRILVEDYEDKLDEEGKRLINIVRENTGKMGQLIDDILQLSRASRQAMKMYKIDMEALVRDIFKEVNSVSKGRKESANEHVQLEIKPLPVAYGDQTLIRQVLTNLISNSIKFTRPIKNPLIEVGVLEGEDEGKAETKGNYNVYYVRDNGVGFNMKYSDKLFGLFQRLHGQDEFEGTGVGLSIVQRIIRRHGGYVWGQGEVNKGATIYFSLPYEKRT